MKFIDAERRGHLDDDEDEMAISFMQQAGREENRQTERIDKSKANKAEKKER